MTPQLPLFYFPPTICWVDDNQLFLEAVSRFFKDDYSCVTFIESDKAVDFLRARQDPYKNINFTREFTENDLFNAHNHLPIDINIAAIAGLAHDLPAKNDPSILIVDNCMPKINGIELCQMLKGTRHKKILVTGEANFPAAVQAFNEGIIDRFIEKDQHFTQNLRKSITELGQQYFYDKTRNLLSHLEVARPSPLSDPIFIEFFHAYLKETCHNEFYLLDKHGSFLLKKSDGTTSFFVLMSERDKHEFIEQNDDAFDRVGNLLQKVIDGKSLPFFGANKAWWQFPYHEWEKHFHPASLLQGREKYYWSIVQQKEEVA